jgi:hypothetical protein
MCDYIWNLCNIELFIHIVILFFTHIKNNNMHPIISYPQVFQFFGVEILAKTII